MFEELRQYRRVSKRLKEDPGYYDTGLFSRKKIWDETLAEDWQLMLKAMNDSRPMRRDGTFADADETEKIYYYKRKNGTPSSFMVANRDGRTVILTEDEYRGVKKRRRPQAARRLIFNTSSAIES